MRERDQHDQFEAWLRRHGIPYSHERMDKPTTGVVGDPDFRCYRNNMVAFVEFKVHGQKLKPEQVKRHAELELAGCTVRTCTCVEDAIRHVETEFGPNAVLSDSEKPEQASGRMENITIDKNGQTQQAAPKLWRADARHVGAVVVSRNPHTNVMGFVRMARSEADRALPIWREELDW